MMTTDDHHWQEGIAPDPEKYFGFVYEMHHLPTGKMYIGKKNYWKSYGDYSGRWTNKSTPEWRPEQWQESDWRTYTSSSKPVNKLLAEGHKDEWEFTILRNCYSDRHTRYAETRAMVNAGVMEIMDDDGTRRYLNGAIPAFYGSANEVYFGTREVGSGTTRTDRTTLAEAKLKEHGPGRYALGLDCDKCGFDNWEVRRAGTNPAVVHSYCYECKKRQDREIHATRKAEWAAGIPIIGKPCPVCANTEKYWAGGCIDQYKSWHKKQKHEMFGDRRINHREDLQ